MKQNNKQIKVAEKKKREKKFQADDPFPSRLCDLLGVSADKKENSSRGKFKALADELGISVPTVSQYASGLIAPNFDNLVKIAKYFHVSTDYLCGLSDQPTDNPDEASTAKYIGLSPESVRALHFIDNMPDSSSKKRRIIDFLNRELRTEWKQISARVSFIEKSGLQHNNPVKNVYFDSVFEDLEKYVVGAGEPGYHELGEWRLNKDELFRDKALEHARFLLDRHADKAGIVADTESKTNDLDMAEIEKIAKDMRSRELVFTSKEDLEKLRDSLANDLHTTPDQIRFTFKKDNEEE